MIRLNKPGLIVAMLAVFLIFSSTTGYASYFPNGDIEAFTDYNPKPTPIGFSTTYYLGEPANTVATYQIRSDIKYEGTNGLLLRSQYYGSTLYYYAIYWDGVDLTGHTNISYMLKSQSVQGSSYIAICDNGTFNNPVTLGSVSSVTQSWVPQIKNIGANTGTKRVIFYAYANIGGMDNNGTRDFYLDDFRIDNVPLYAVVPIANFTVNNTTGYYPLCVQFNDTSLNNPTSWAWDFNNDGTTDSTVQNPTYIYNNVDDYTVTLTATNSAGSDSEIKVDLIGVYQPAPVFGEGTGGAGTTTTTTGNAPFPVTFQSNATGDNLALSWDFGDGTTSTEAAPTHTYTTPGTYTVTVTITNLGGTISDTFTITVPGFVHSANITGAIGSTAGLHARFNDTSTMDVVNDTTTDLTSFSMGRLIYDATKPLSLYGVGDWWIIILLGVIAAIIILGQNNSPFLTILLLMIGNLALWGLASKHFDMLGTVTTLALFSLAMIGISVYKGSKSRG